MWCKRAPYLTHLQETRNKLQTTLWLQSPSSWPAFSKLSGLISIDRFHPQHQSLPRR
ncbi:hypothetical protein QWZ16_16090 [Vibrio ostreicida]|uniref:Uncharacterized protein n=1 Tax=Vibrio ostreicida TaxID=526588 RepID=A0ABT8BVW3_9VIBR|nr:hypothetical protein [Vibrio ostreicida]MDN3611161.1 hypothetical protein [Vibrio ostreicida]